MKKISFSFQVKIPLKRRDVHWIEGEVSIFNLAKKLGSWPINSTRIF